MLSYSFDNLNNTSLYEHLYNCIKKDILNKKLLPDVKLPSKRTLAANLGISVITIENAYEQLVAEGYIYTIPRKGFYVSDIDSVMYHSKIERSVCPTNVIQSKPCFFADFTSNQTASDNFPFSIWSKLLRKTLSENQNELMINPPAGGSHELRNAIARHLNDFRNMTISPEQIIIGAGTEYLYGLIIQLLGHNKIYAVENPGYNKIAKIYESNNVCCKYINIDNEGIIPDKILSEEADIIHISPSHHFPTGIIMPVKRRYELLDWASEDENRYIIEDDYDSEFRFTGQMIPTLQSMDKHDKVIYINTFTKSLSSTIRISYMVLPPQLLNIFYSKMSFYSSAVSTFEQLTLARFISEGHFERHINRMRNYYRIQRDALLDTIKKSRLSSYISISEENSGLHFLMRINTELSDDEFIKRAAEKNIKLSSLSQYYVASHNNTSHCFIINYSSLKKEHMKEAIELLYDCL